MTEFNLYFQLGMAHIADLNAYDHILFVLTLAVAYPLAAWKKLVGLVTAFTIGHSLSLALAVLRYIQLPTELIEFLIPCTILMSVWLNFFQIDQKEKNIQFHYLIVLVFGLIHGVGFSNYLQALLGQETNILQPLFAFNIGLEVGQLLILSIFFTLNTLIKKLLRISEKSWNIMILGSVQGITLLLLRDTWLW